MMGNFNKDILSRNLMFRLSKNQSVNLGIKVLREFRPNMAKCKSGGYCYIKQRIILQRFNHQMI